MTRETTDAGAGRRKPRLRMAAVLSALSTLSVLTVVGLGGVLSSAGTTPSASAFDCNGAKRCPYVKISNRDKHNVDYEVWGYIYSKSDPNTHIYDWHENDPTYTLWHWRWYGGEEWYINLKVDSKGYGASNSKTFDLSANDSLCIAVDRAGAYQSIGCTDAEDPAYGAGG